MDSASAHNLALAGSWLGAANACGHADRQATLDDIFSVASLDIVSLVPQADDMTSDLSRPGLLWSWSGSYPQNAAFALAGENGCPDGEMELYTPGSARLLEGKLEYHYGNAVRAAALSSDGPNPVELELDENSLRQEDYAGLHAPLLVRISGKVSVTYSYRKSEYRQSCTVTGDYVGCGCEEKTEYGTTAYERQVADQRNFSVETGQDGLFWLNPPLKARLDGAVDAKALFFARRLPARISASADGRRLGENSPSRFETVTGACGQMLVQSEYAPDENGMDVSVADKTLFPYQLVAKNASCLPFYLKFAWDESPGRKWLLVETEDWFSNRRNYTYEFFVRSPAPYSDGGQSSAMQIRQGSQDKTPAAYPSRQEAGNIPRLGALAILLGAAALAAVGGAFLHGRRME